MTTTRTKELIKLAKNTNDRKNIESDLKKARKNFSKARDDHEDASRALADAQRKVDETAQAMENAKRTIVEYGEYIRNMDLTGAESIRHRDDFVNYIIDGKEYYVDDSDVNDVKVEPWKEYKKKMLSEKSSDEDDEEEEEKIEEDDEDDILKELGILTEAEEVDNRDLPHDYNEKLSDLKTIASDNVAEFKVAFSEIVDMSKGFNPGYIREINFPGWKNQHFQELIRDLRDNS